MTQNREQDVEFHGSVKLILSCFLQGMPNFLFMHSKEWHCFVSENKTRAKPLCELGIHCLQSSPFELLDFPDK